MFAERGVRVHVLPSNASLEQILDLKRRRRLPLQRPGDPATADGAVHLTKEVLGAGMPLFGICFGNQILGRALGLGTYKMKFGHRGINIPVIEHERAASRSPRRTTGSRSRARPGEEFDTPFGKAVISHTCANDGAVEGVRLLDGSAFSVQYHPEAAAGPHDAAYLFDRFTSLLEGVKN